MKQLTNLTEHQENQLKVIAEMERQVLAKDLKFSTVDPINDYDADPRTCLTSVHFITPSLFPLVNQIQNTLKAIEPNHYYYRENSLHTTIKNVKGTSNPPKFTEQDIATALSVFEATVPQYKSFNEYFYRLMLFENNLVLIGLSDPELDNLTLALDTRLKAADVSDTKAYVNEKYFFSIVNLVRFYHPVSEKFKQTVQQLSDSLPWTPYTVDSVSLVVANAVMSRVKTIKRWSLDAKMNP